ncbi:DNA-binding protein WhiA [Papillibacter cinnamivorans]|uniref:Probable cell division protein WhiA n=1 Tax=Papillibacter cinnamivorans DSM 12816 TaxID=1122930 RepID=A0A1W1YMW1_9FIRM|nr:DNA-binding protein WhiA [Papillibacter cinnamivorans]SMC37489.1 hypothetical protein SAMN02745168_0546 [Papillibacter cinnamivorans DSM 12816]
MSFSSETKAELCRIPMNKTCCARAEAYGVLLYCNTFSPVRIRIVTGSRPVAARLPKLFYKAFRLRFDLLPDSPDVSGKLHLEITDPKKLREIFDAFGYTPGRHISHDINFGLLEEDCCRQAFLRGAFLAGGSVTDPEKRYHLELATPHFKVSRELFALLLDMSFSPKAAPRNANYITYFKQSESIEDFLTTIGAPVSAMKIMSAKVEKHLRSGVNRRVNCDTANLGKAVDAAQEHLDAIRRLREKGMLDALPEKLRETARLRTEHPEATLSELAVLFEPPVTKSCLCHRLRKLDELSR